jgi:hypothetical protein
MKRALFEQLSKEEQLKIVGEHGVFIAERIEDGNRFYLYVVNSFYVELLHELSNFNNKGIVIAHVFSEAEMPEAYISDAAMDHLFA